MGIPSTNNGALRRSVLFPGGSASTRTDACRLQAIAPFLALFWAFATQCSARAQALPDPLPVASLFPDIPLTRWVDQKIVFLRLNPDVRQLGYPDWHSVSDSGEEMSAGTPYEELAEKTATVQSVNSNASGESITVKLDGNGKCYRAHLLTDFVDDVAYLEDIQKAAKMFPGRRLIFLSGLMEREDGTVIQVKRYCPVRVLDVIPGESDFAPVRFRFQTDDNQRGHADVFLGTTNLYPQDASRFSNVFLITDPRTKHPWSRKIWAAIEAGRPIVGMTEEAARMATGTSGDVSHARHSTTISETKFVDFTEKVTIRHGVVTAVVDKPTKPQVLWDTWIFPPLFEFSSENGTRELHGSIQNRSRFTYNLKVKIRFKDNEGNQVGTGEQSTDHIPPRTWWKFRIPAPPDATKWELISVSGSADAIHMQGVPAVTRLNIAASNR